jgi:hypothetical protein
MLGYSTLKSAIDYLLSTGIVAKVYHDVYILENLTNRYPVYDEGDEKIYVGVDDRQIMNCYFRQTGEANLLRSEFVGSSKKIFKARAPFRVVFFNDFEERSFDSLIEKILKLSLFENIEFARIYTDREQVRILESDRKNFTFGGKTFYIAVDVNVTFTTFSDDCNVQIDCEALPNPIAGCAPVIQRTNNELDPIWNAQKGNYYTKAEIDLLLAGLAGDEDQLLLPVTSDGQTDFNIFDDPTGTKHYLSVNGVAYFEQFGNYSISLGINNKLIWAGPFIITTDDELIFSKL